MRLLLLWLYDTYLTLVHEHDGRMTRRPTCEAQQVTYLIGLRTVVERRRCRRRGRHGRHRGRGRTGAGDQRVAVQLLLLILVVVVLLLVLQVRTLMLMHAHQIADLGSASRTSDRLGTVRSVRGGGGADARPLLLAQSRSVGIGAELAGALERSRRLQVQMLAERLLLGRMADEVLHGEVRGLERRTGKVRIVGVDSSEIWVFIEVNRLCFLTLSNIERANS